MNIQYLHGGSDIGKFCGIVPALADDTASSCQVFVVSGISQIELGLVFPGEASKHAVEDVVVPFPIALLSNQVWSLVIFFLLLRTLSR